MRHGFGKLYSLSKIILKELLKYLHLIGMKFMYLQPALTLPSVLLLSVNSKMFSKPQFEILHEVAYFFFFINPVSNNFTTKSRTCHLHHDLDSFHYSWRSLKHKSSKVVFFFDQDDQVGLCPIPLGKTYTNIARIAFDVILQYCVSEVKKCIFFWTFSEL